MYYVNKYIYILVLETEVFLMMLIKCFPYCRAKVDHLGLEDHLAMMEQKAFKVKKAQKDQLDYLVPL